MLAEDSDGTLLYVRVIPGAKRSEVAGVFDDRLRVRVQAPPVEGKANRELIKYLSRTLDLRKSRISVRQGESSREKTILLKGISLPEALLKLKRLLPEE